MQYLRDIRYIQTVGLLKLRHLFSGHGHIRPKYARHSEILKKKSSLRVSRLQGTSMSKIIKIGQSIRPQRIEDKMQNSQIKS